MSAPAPSHSGAPAGALRTALALLGGVLLLGLMGMTVVDVIGRYVFNAPLVGATVCYPGRFEADVVAALLPAGEDRGKER